MKIINSNKKTTVAILLCAIFATGLTIDWLKVNAENKVNTAGIDTFIEKLVTYKSLTCKSDNLTACEAKFDRAIKKANEYAESKTGKPIIKKIIG